MRGQGALYLPKNGRGEYSKVYWYKFGFRGKVYTGSTETTSKTAAYDVLRKKIGEVKSGLIVGRPERVTLAQLKDISVKQYSIDQLKTTDRLLQYWAHLEKFFDLNTRAMDIPTTRLDDYTVKRLAQGAKPQTVKNELSALRRGFNLAIEKGLLVVMPKFNLPTIQNVREGFFTEGELAALLLELPTEVRDLVQFLAATGWRREEGRLLQWSMVDLDECVIRLEGKRSKSGQPRTFPFALAPELKTLLERLWVNRKSLCNSEHSMGLFVFHENGHPLGITRIRNAWRGATRRAGLVGKLIHDLRRSAAVAFRRSGIDEGTIMKLAGWETDEMFRRYNIINEADLAEAVSKRFGKTMGRQPSPTPNRIQLSPYPLTGPAGIEPATPGFGDRSKYAHAQFIRLK